MFYGTTRLIPLLAMGLLHGPTMAQPLSPLQAITACNQEAQVNGIEGDARREFTTTCLRKLVRDKDKSAQHNIHESVERASKRLEGVRERIDAAVAHLD